MGSNDEELPRPIQGAIWYLDVCATAVRVQEERLLREEGDPTVDLWLTLVALRNALRAVDLAIQVAPDPTPLRESLSQFAGSEPARQIRNVFEHFDEYFIGEGKLQKGQLDPARVVPRISTLYAGEIRVTVTVGDYELEIPSATKAAGDLLWDVKKLLRKQAQ